MHLRAAARPRETARCAYAFQSVQMLRSAHAPAARRTAPATRARDGLIIDRTDAPCRIAAQRSRGLRFDGTSDFRSERHRKEIDFSRTIVDNKNFICARLTTARGIVFEPSERGNFSEKAFDVKRLDLTAGRVRNRT